MIQDIVDKIRTITTPRNPAEVQHQVNMETEKKMHEIINNAQVKMMDTVPEHDPNIMTSTLDDISDYFTYDNKQLPILIQKNNTYYPITKHTIKRVPGKCRKYTGGRGEALIIHLNEKEGK